LLNKESCFLWENMNIIFTPKDLGNLCQSLQKHNKCKEESVQYAIAWSILCFPSSRWGTKEVNKQQTSSLWICSHGLPPHLRYNYTIRDTCLLVRVSHCWLTQGKKLLLHKEQSLPDAMSDAVSSLLVIYMNFGWTKEELFRTAWSSFLHCWSSWSTQTANSPTHTYPWPSQ